MGMGRASRRRTERRRRRLEAGEFTEGDLRRFLSDMQKEAEYRARVAFGEIEDGASRVAPAVWALYRSKLPEAMRLEAFRLELVARKLEDARRAEKASDDKTATKLRTEAAGMPVPEELAEYCRRAVARYMPDQKVHLGPARPRVMSCC